MNKDSLRKVIYQRNGDLNLFEAGFDDDKEMKKVRELRKKRKGLFHQWKEVESIALIENDKGKIEEIEARFIKFID